MCSHHVAAGCRRGDAGAGGSEGATCGCGGGRMKRFLEPCLLLLLLRGQAHGYELLRQLQEFGFDPDQQDPGLMYRTLRRLERDGYLTSSWDTESGGPARRLYEVTLEGKDLLHAWAGVIQRNVQTLQAFLRSYRGQAGDAE